MEFVARKGKSGFVGLFKVEGESEEVHGNLDNKSLTLIEELLFICYPKLQP